MIDFHTHILPKVDDGSRSVDESLLMLQSMKEQKVSTVIATPHFYANDELVDDFIQRRNAAYGLLPENAPNLPNIVLGAEVRYYDGISRLQDLKKLRIEGSRFLLLEMPFAKWTEYAVKEIIDIANRGSITLVLAHIDRYLQLQKKEVITRLINNNVLFQANASFFSQFLTKATALTMLRNNQLHFIGSDCHNMTERPPNISKAFCKIENKFGKAFVKDYIEYSKELFNQNLINQ